MIAEAFAALLRPGKLFCGPASKWPLASKIARNVPGKPLVCFCWAAGAASSEGLKVAVLQEELALRESGFVPIPRWSGSAELAKISALHACKRVQQEVWLYIWLGSWLKCPAKRIAQNERLLLHVSL